MRETDTGKWILDRSNIQSVYLGGRFLAWPLEDEGRGVSVSVTKPAHLITGGSKSSVHQNRPRPRANGQRNEIQSIDSSCRCVELSVAQMANRMATVAAAAIFAVLIGKTATGTIIRVTIQPTIGKSTSVMLTDLTCASAWNGNWQVLSQSRHWIATPTANQIPLAAIY